MCDIPEGLKDWDADSRDGAPVGGGAGKQMVGGMISPSLGRAKMERGQHLPPLPKQNKPRAREPLWAWRPSKRGGSCLQTGPAPAATTHPRLPRLIGGFESCRPASAACPSLRERTGLPRSQPGRWRGGGMEGGGEPCSSRVVLRSFQIAPWAPGVLGGPGAAKGKKRRWPRRTARSFLLSRGSSPCHRGGPGHPVRAEG